MLKSRIAAGAKAMGIAINDGQLQQFERYQQMLSDANRTMNLTRVPLDDVREVADFHYLDSIAPLGVAGYDWMGAQSLLDVGSGAGLPGIPLAIMLPGTHTVLLDSLQKRVKFLSDVIEALHLNAEAIHLRAEDAAHLPDYREQFDLVTARAVAGLPQLLELTLPFVRVGGYLVSYKGPSLDEELPSAQHALRHLGGGAEKVLPVTLPDRDWDHRLLIVQKRRPTPKPYPRKPAEITKKPL
ncbi:16S rRNA (guanine(527)-N(7))-methyltransferase RsmG [Eubacteriales bacterium OttesenSCG-928-N13]|nr:16S rRNA (guanine(527)-N(7))-methyltransferase RsmG [Eubacteriales bacterium OttesenSCG-928-N13]